MVAFLADVHGVLFPDGRQEFFQRGDRAKIPATHVPDLARRQLILVLGEVPDG